MLKFLGGRCVKSCADRVLKTILFFKSFKVDDSVIVHLNDNLFLKKLHICFIDCLLLEIVNKKRRKTIRN